MRYDLEKQTKTGITAAPVIRVAGILLILLAPPALAWAGIMHIMPPEVSASGEYIRIGIGAWDGVKGVKSVKICNDCDACASGRSITFGKRLSVEQGEAFADVLIPHTTQPTLYSVQMTYLSRDTGKMVTDCLADGLEVLPSETTWAPEQEKAVVIPSSAPKGDEVQISVTLPYQVAYCREIKLTKGCQGEWVQQGRDITASESGEIVVTFDLGRVEPGIYSLVGVYERAAEPETMHSFCTENSFQVLGVDNTGQMVVGGIGVLLMLSGIALIFKGIRIRANIPES